MNVQLKHVVPVPLAERLGQRKSDIWNQDLTLPQGSKVHVVAPSGTGKTTLVHTIWHLRSDYTGIVQYGDKDVAKLSAADLAMYRQNKLSIVFQDLRLFGKLTALENIELKRNMSVQVACTANEALHMAEVLGISSILHRPVATCSYGEQQRIAIIRALVQPFTWLIMDEPFSHLDQKNIALAAQLITDACLKRDAGFILTDLNGTDIIAHTHKLFL